MTATAEFLGPAAGWSAAYLALNDVQGLWGGRVVYLAGAGRLLLQHVERGRMETRHALELPAAEAQAALALCGAHDLLNLTLPARPGIPDEAYITLTLINPAGAIRAVGKWAGQAHPGFQALYAQLLGWEQRARAAPALYRGPYQADFRPAWFP